MNKMLNKFIPLLELSITIILDCIISAVALLILSFAFNLIENFNVVPKDNIFMQSLKSILYFSAISMLILFVAADILKFLIGYFKEIKSKIESPNNGAE